MKTTKEILESKITPELEVVASPQLFQTAKLAMAAFMEKMKQKNNLEEAYDSLTPEQKKFVELKNNNVNYDLKTLKAYTDTFRKILKIVHKKQENITHEEKNFVQKYHKEINDMSEILLLVKTNINEQKKEKQSEKNNYA